MYLDKQNQFSDAQAITADAISTNVIDLAPLGGSNLIRDIAAGKPVGVLISVSTAFVSAGSGTLTVTAESDDNTSLSSATVHQTIASAVAAATLVAGYAMIAWLQPGAYQRYLGLRYTTNTADFEAGAVNAWLVSQFQNNRAYSDNATNSA